MWAQGGIAPDTAESYGARAAPGLDPIYDPLGSPAGAAARSPPLRRRPRVARTPAVRLPHGRSAPPPPWAGPRWCARRRRRHERCYGSAGPASGPAARRACSGWPSRPAVWLQPADRALRHSRLRRWPSGGAWPSACPRASASSSRSRHRPERRGWRHGGARHGHRAVSRQKAAHRSRGRHGRRPACRREHAEPPRRALRRDSRLRRLRAGQERGPRGWRKWRASATPSRGPRGRAAAPRLPPARAHRAEGGRASRKIMRARGSHARAWPPR